MSEDEFGDRTGTIPRSKVRDAIFVVGMILAARGPIEVTISETEREALNALKHVMDWNHKIVIEKDD